jgi:DNA-binding MarR family transcriptional regulator
VAKVWCFRAFGPCSSGTWLRHCSGVNVPGETIGAAASSRHAAARRACAQDEVATLLRDLIRELRRQVPRLAASAGGLGWPALAVLQEISGHPGITVNELARLTGIPKSRVSVLLTRLAALRVVRKDDDDRDSRLVRLHITPEGRRRAEQWQAASRQAVSTLLEPLTDAELDTVAVGLAALDRAFRRAQRQDQPIRAGAALPC